MPPMVNILNRESYFIGIPLSLSSIIIWSYCISDDKSGNEGEKVPEEYGPSEQNGPSILQTLKRSIRMVSPVRIERNWIIQIS